MKANKNVYILLTMFLGLLISFLAHAIIEIKLIIRCLHAGTVPFNYSSLGHGYCFLPVSLQVALILGGVVGGYFLGEWWWRVVYVEHKHWSKRKSHKK